MTKKIKDPFKSTEKFIKKIKDEPTYPTMNLIPLYYEEPNSTEKKIVGFYDREITKCIYSVGRSKTHYDSFTDLINISYNDQLLHNTMMKFPEYKEAFEEIVKTCSFRFQEGEIVIGNNSFYNIKNKKFEVGKNCYFSTIYGFNNINTRYIIREMRNLNTDIFDLYKEEYFLSIKEQEILLIKNKEFNKQLKILKEIIKKDMIGAELKYKGKTYYL